MSCYCVMFGLPNKHDLLVAVNMLFYSACSQVGQRWLYRDLPEGSRICLINVFCLQKLFYCCVGSKALV